MEGLQAYLTPQTQLDHYHIISNTQEVDLRTDRTRCTTRGREETILRKVEGEETWFGGEMDQGTAEGRKPGQVSKGAWSARECAQEEHFPKAIFWENKRGWFS